MTLNQSHSRLRQLIRICIALGLVIVCYYLVRTAVKTGLARLYSASVLKGAMLPGTDPEQLIAISEEATRLAPSDPETIRARGVAQLFQQQPAEAAKEYAHAVALRPRHYLLWLDMGRARDQADDVDGAIEAFQEAVRLAPYFAQPRWQLANVLFRAERYDEAFPQLRRAIAGDPTLLPLSMELAWAGSRGDAEKFKQMIDPSSASQRLLVGRFLAKHGKAREAVELFHATGGIAEADQKALVKELLLTKQYASAYEVWASGRKGLDQNNHGIATITDGGFEEKIALDDTGFGWHINSGVSTFRVTIETTMTREGSRSLRGEWNGDSNPVSQLVTELVLVDPNTNYHLSFFALSKGLVSGGLPVVTVSDASSKDYKVLGESAVFTEGEREWTEYKVDFKTGEKTDAILMSLQRKSCSTNQCPIFGRVWLDAFTLRKA